MFRSGLAESCVCTLRGFSRVRVFATPWTVARQAPLSMGFSGQEEWSGLPRPLPGDLPHPGIKPTCPVSAALAGGFFTFVPAGKPVLDHTVALFLSFLRTLRALPHGGCTHFFPTRTVGGLPLLHTFSSICHFSPFRRWPFSPL